MLSLTVCVSNAENFTADKCKIMALKLQGLEQEATCFVNVMVSKLRMSKLCMFLF